MPTVSASFPGASNTTGQGGSTAWTAFAATASWKSTESPTSGRKRPSSGKACPSSRKTSWDLREGSAGRPRLAGLGDARGFLLPLVPQALPLLAFLPEPDPEDGRHWKAEPRLERGDATTKCTSTPKSASWGRSGRDCGGAGRGRARAPGGPARSRALARRVLRLAIQRECVRRTPPREGGEPCEKTRRDARNPGLQAGRGDRLLQRQPHHRGPIRRRGRCLR